MRLAPLAATVFAAAALAQGALAQQQEVPDPAQPSASDRPRRAPAGPTSMPFELRDNLVTIDTVINGRKQRAVLDSGSGALIVDRAYAKTIGLGEGQSAGDAAGAGEQSQQLRPVSVASLDVGPLRFNQLPGYALNMEQLSLSAGFPVDLLIGAPAFKHGAVSVDYRRRVVTFGPSGSMGTCAAPIPLTVVHDVPVVEVALRPTPGAEATRLRLVVDLGTRHRAMILGGPFVRSAAGQALLRSGVAQQVGHGIGGQVQGSVGRIAELQLGTASIADVEVALVPVVPAFEAGGVDGVLGVPFWKEGVITFDYPAHTLCIER